MFGLRLFGIMLTAAAALEFESAAQLRDKIKELKKAFKIK